MDPIKIVAILINLLLNSYKMMYNQGLSIQLSPTLYNEKEEEYIDIVITQVFTWLLKGYSRGNHKPIFGLQLLAYLQSERTLSL